MWRRWMLGAAVFCWPLAATSPALATQTPPPTTSPLTTSPPTTSASPPSLSGFAEQRAAFFAERLRTDPVYVTDNAPDQLAPGTADQIKAIVAPLHVPTYVVVTLTGLSRTDADTADTLVPLIHDRLGRDGIYVVTSPSGGGTALQYGGSLPIEQAWEATDLELPYDNRPLLTYLRHFVALITSGQATAHYAHPQRPAEAKAAPDPWDEHDRAERLARYAGMASGLPVAVVLLFWRNAIRRSRRALKAKHS